jgi:hypothetical protein
VSRQVLPRQRSEAPPQIRRGTTATTVTAPAAPERPARGLRRPAVLALVAGGTAVLGGLGWMLVRAPWPAPAEASSVLLRPQASAAASPTPTPSPTATQVGTAGDPEGMATARDPFGGDSAPVAPTTQAPSGVVPGSRAVPGTSPDAVPTTAPTTAPPASPQASGPVVPTTFPVVTATVTRTASPSVTPTVTVTATAPGSAVYVGFYAWNGTRASFRVNARTYSYPVGTTFGPQLTFTSIRSGTPRCAVLEYQPKSYRFTLCPGQVVRLP